MPGQIFISKLNPLKFRRKVADNPMYQTKDMDTHLYPESAHPLDATPDFAQPWQTSDTIRLQFLADVFPVTINMMSCSGLVVGTFVCDQIESSMSAYSSLRVYEASIPLLSYQTGRYYFTVDFGSVQLDSEVIDLQVSHPVTLLFEYFHDQNLPPLLFETGIKFQQRVYGGLREYQPGAERKVFIDQPQNATQLSSYTNETWALLIGRAEGVPNYVIQRVNELFRCSTVLIDGKQFTLPEGANWQATRSDFYSLTGWRTDVRVAKSGGGEVLAIDPDGDIVIVYGLEQGDWGNITTPAQGNIIQIID